MTLGQVDLFPRHLPLHRLSTNSTTARYPFHRWFNFVAGFSPEFVEKCANEANLTPDACILDPFAGCGTTLVEANLLGRRSIGYEAHPFLAEICNAKLCITEAPELMGAIAQELRDLSPAQDPAAFYSEPARRFLASLLPEGALNVLIAARAQVDRHKHPKRLLSALLISRVLELASHSKTDGIYKAPTSRKKSVLYAEAVDHIAELMSEDLALSAGAGFENRATLYSRSSEDMAELQPRSIDLLITSPPYLNNFDFAEMTRMHLYFWGYANTWGDITEKVRAKLIVNTTTALKGHRERMEAYREETPGCVRQELDDYRVKLAHRKRAKAGKKDYDLLIYPYFAQMTRVLRSALQALRPGAPVHIIVSDAALYGVHVQAPQVLGRIMQALGFGGVQVSKMRDRGTRWTLTKREGAEAGLGEYHITAAAL